MEGMCAESEQEKRRKRKKLVFDRIVIRTSSIMNAILLTRENAQRKVDERKCRVEDRNLFLDIDGSEPVLPLILVANTAQPVDVLLLEHFVA